MLAHRPPTLSFWQLLSFPPNPLNIPNSPTLATLLFYLFFDLLGRRTTLPAGAGTFSLQNEQTGLASLDIIIMGVGGCRVHSAGGLSFKPIPPLAVGEDGSVRGACGVGAGRKRREWI